MKGQSRKIPEDIKARNSKELQALSESLANIVDRTTAIESHIQALEMAKQYRTQKIKSKDISKKESPQHQSFDDVTISSIDLDISKTSPVQSYSKSVIGSQIASKPVTNKNTANQPSLRMFLNMINQMRRDVSELATRQNEMKFELEKIRVRLC